MDQVQEVKKVFQPCEIYEKDDAQFYLRKGWVRQFQSGTSKDVERDVWTQRVRTNVACKVQDDE